MNSDRYLFLDIDGVINTYATQQNEWVKLPRARDLHRAQFGFPDVAPFTIQNLNKITRETGAKIVISSTLRLGSDSAFSDLVDYLKFRGVEGHIIGRTPSLRWKNSTALRGHEIDEWLDGKVPYENIVILDDDSDMEHLIHRLVKCSMKEGLTEELALKAIELLDSSVAVQDKLE